MVVTGITSYEQRYGDYLAIFSVTSSVDSAAVTVAMPAIARKTTSN